MATYNKTATDGLKAADLEPGCSPNRAGIDGSKASDSATAVALGFGSQRQAILDGLISSQNEAAGWNAQRVNIPLSAVVRTSANIVTITLPALPGYNITAPETVIANVPGSALSNGLSQTAGPAMGVAVTAGNTYSKTGTDGVKARDDGTVIRTFLKDTFTDIDTSLPFHVGEIGATWTNHPAVTAFGRTANNRLRSGGGTTNPKAAYASGLPGVSCLIRFDLFVVSIETGHVVAVAARLNTTAMTAYLFGYSQPLGAWALWKVSAGTLTLLQSSAATLTVGQTYALEFLVTNGQKRGSVNGVAVVTSADNTITPSDRIGVYYDDGSIRATNAIGFHYDNLLGTDETATGLAKAGTDGTKAGESATAPRNRNVSGTDGAKAADTSTTLATWARAGTDGAKATDQATAGAGRPKSAADGVKASDDATTAVVRTRTGTDGAKAGDSATRILGFAKTGTDGAKAADTSTAPRLRAGVGTDGAKAADTPTVAQARLGAGTDGTKAGENSTVARSRPVAGSDGVKVADIVTVLKATPPAVIAAAGNDGIKVADVSSTVGNFARSATDGVKAGETQTAIRDRPASATDGAKATESSSGLRTVASQASDGARAADDASRIPILVATGIDTALAGEDASRRKADVVTSADGAKAGDSALGLHDVPRTVTEGVTAADSAEGIRTRAVEVTEGMLARETLAIPHQLVAEATDGCQASDSTTQGFDPHVEARVLWLTGPELEVSGITDVELVI